MRNKKLIRAIAIILAVLLVGGVVFSALFSALAEEQTEVGASPRNRIALSMEYLEDGQALHITQRLIYVNPSGRHLEGVVFYAAGNMFRRQSALMYDEGDLPSVFFDGYTPAGIDLRGVSVDGKPTDFGFQDENELYLRAACDLAPGQTCEFEFDYYLLLMRCGAFQGAGDTDVRLSAFCFVPGAWDERYGGFDLNKPLPYTRWLHCDAADYTAELTLPENWLLAGTGEIALLESGEGGCLWQVEAQGVRDFALSFGMRWRAFEDTSASGVRVRVLTNVRGTGRRALDAAVLAIDQCEEWFGAFPVRSFDIIQSDYPLGALGFPGTVWIPTDMMQSSNARNTAQAIRRCVARQYFGLSAYVEPSADAWMTDAVSEYVACLLLEEAEGRDRFLSWVNRDWVSALHQTVPGGLVVTSDAALFDSYSYDIVVLKRGAVVLHELRLAMGREQFIEGLAGFWRMGRDGHTLTELEFVQAMDDATGRSWEDFLTDWLFNVGDYVQQDMDWFE